MFPLPMKLFALHKALTCLNLPPSLNQLSVFTHDVPNACCTKCRAFLFYFRQTWSKPVLDLAPSQPLRALEDCKMATGFIVLLGCYDFFTSGICAAEVFFTLPSVDSVNECLAVNHKLCLFMLELLSSFFEENLAKVILEFEGIGLKRKGRSMAS